MFDFFYAGQSLVMRWKRARATRNVAEETFNKLAAACEGNVRQDLYRVSMFIRYLGGSVSKTTVQQWLYI